MRLSPAQNDALLGGDVDLYLETSERNADQLVDSQLRFLADLHDTPEFDRERIELVVRSPLPGNGLPVHRGEHRCRGSFLTFSSR